ncbi:MAG: DUF1653 domain-containing protein [Alphaproteobacteria bacterium]
MKLGKYKHFKGNLYEVVGIARYSEDIDKQFVVYKSLYTKQFPEGQLWVRPYEMFNEEIERDGKKMKRFEYVGEE